jgi:hypothetical protein
MNPLNKYPAISKTKIGLILISSCLFSCAPLVLLIPEQSDVKRIEQTYPGISLEDLAKGKTFYETNCNKCHSLKWAFKISDNKLYEVIPSMAEKAKIDSKTQDLILKYLITMKPVQQKK